MVLTKTLKFLSLIVVLVSIGILILEKNLPEQEVLRNVQDLPPDLISWFNRGKYYNVFGHKVFAIWTGGIAGTLRTFLNLLKSSILEFPYQIHLLWQCVFS